MIFDDCKVNKIISMWSIEKHCVYYPEVDNKMYLLFVLSPNPCVSPNLEIEKTHMYHWFSERIVSYFAAKSQWVYIKLIPTTC